MNIIRVVAPRNYPYLSQAIAAISKSLPMALALCTVLSLSGCLPIPTGRVEKNTAGIQANLPAALPSVGITSRSEVEKQYRQVEVESGIPSLFWAQFERSRWGIIYGGASPTQGAAFGAQQLWHAYNLFVSFDDKQVARSVELVKFNQLVSWSRTAEERGLLPPLALSLPITLEGANWSGPAIKNVHLELSAAELRVTVAKRGPSRNKSKVSPPRFAEIPVRHIEKISVHDIDREHKWQDAFQHCPFQITLHFDESTPVGRRLSVYLLPKDALTVIRWYNQRHTTQTVKSSPKVQPKSQPEG